MKVTEWHEIDTYYEDERPHFEKFYDKQPTSEARYAKRRMDKAAPQQFIDAMCLGKAPFETFSLAEDVVRRHRSKRKGRHLIKIYRCRVCRRWHIMGTR